MTLVPSAGSDFTIHSRIGQVSDETSGNSSSASSRWSSRLLDAPLDMHNELLLKRGYMEDAIDAEKVELVVSSQTTKRRRRHRLTSKQLWEKSQRDADASRVLNLTLDVNDLRQQVHNCLVQKSLWETRQLVAREQFHARSLQSVDHFFQLFGHGYPAALTANEEKFLTVLLDDNIAVGDGVRGRAEFYEQWRRYKQVFNVRRLTNFSARVVTSDGRGCLIECSGEFEGRVTTAALETVFPNALADKALSERVLHRRFVCPTRTLISIDSSACLVQYDAESDVFEAMSELLDYNPVQVSRLMADVRISEGSMLPPVDNCVHASDCGDQFDGAEATSSVASAKSSINFILS
ncbi:unnamed protein product [Phytophthora fragariaefolia]|uniref:Unnamed protein product n=1 Tax=Phytophthora fragariaefolia TaxID=1490495 RepID=A0A9W6XLS7_9STRA|nr:unnamed protein product [Phytophthora fragariaefolia]